jgi:OOP family OmpA-OmpF porin
MMRGSFLVLLGAVFLGTVVSGCYVPGPANTTCCPSYYSPPPPPPPPPPPAKKRITLRGVNFDLDKSDIRIDAGPILDRAVEILVDAINQRPNLRVVVEGHTDSRASAAYNERLGMRRADAVRSYLISKGLDSSRITAVSFGELQPVASNDTEEGRAQNRRVELRLEGQD